MSGSTYSSFGGIIHSVTKIIVHENYDNNIPDYNVAVVQVRIFFNISIIMRCALRTSIDNQLYLSLLPCKMQFFWTFLQNVTYSYHRIKLWSLLFLRISLKYYIFIKPIVYVHINMADKVPHFSEYFFIYINIRRKMKITKIRHLTMPLTYNIWGRHF